MTEPAPSALVLLADGTEEMELTIVVDVLRRAGVKVTVAGVDGAEPSTCSRGLRIVPDVALAEVPTGQSFDVVVLPGGGGGASRFATLAPVGDLLRRQLDAGRQVAAICAAPSALAAHGVAAGAALTAHSSVRGAVAGHGVWRDEIVVEDGPVVTSRGPGTAFEFAFTLVRRLCGEDVAARVREPMEFPA